VCVCGNIDLRAERCAHILRQGRIESPIKVGPLSELLAPPAPERAYLVGSGRGGPRARAEGGRNRKGTRD
jgi:hypothetical protein